MKNNDQTKKQFGPWRLLMYFSLIFLFMWTILYFFGEILLPFIAGALIAYLLRPLNDKLITICVYPVVSTILCVIVFFSILIVIFVNVIPAFVMQLIAFVNNFSNYITQVAIWLELPINTGILDDISQNTLWNLMDIDLLTNLMLNTESWSWLWDSSYQMIYFFYLAIITPVATFYTLKDWHVLVAMLSKFLNIFISDTYRIHIQRLFVTIDDSLSSFAHGQFMIVLILSVYYIATLTILGLESSIFIALSSSIMIFVPYFGAMFSILLASVVAIGQFSPNYVPFILVLIIYGVGQIIEDLILFPILLGQKMQLHPLLVIVAVFVFTRIFGIVGLWVTIPFIAMIRSLLIYIVSLYDQDASTGTSLNKS